MGASSSPSAPRRRPAPEAEFQRQRHEYLQLGGATTAKTPRALTASAARAIQFQRANLPPRLRQALEPLILHRGRGSH